MKNNKIEQIMEDYKKGIKEIDKKYEVKEVKEVDTKELDEKIKYEKSFIEKLEAEGREVNLELINKAKERLEIAEAAKEKKEKAYEKAKTRREEKLNNVTKLKNSKVALSSGREVTQAEKDKMDKQELEDKAIKQLTEESKSISEQLMKLGQELKEKNEELIEVDYIIRTSTERLEDEIEKRDKLKEEITNIKNELKDLSKMQEDCNKYLEEFRQKSNEQMEEFSKAWNEAKRDEDNTKDSKTSVEEMDLEGLGERIIGETKRMIDEENSKPKTTKNKPEIVISRKPSINYSKYNIRIGSLRKIMKQKPDQIVTKLQGLLPTKSIQELKNLSENIDPVLLEGIVQLKNKNILTDNEINEALKEFDDKKASKKGTDFNVTYDMKDLSKWAFLPWNRKDRDKIAQLAEDNRDRGIANFKDGQEYEPNPIKRMFKRVTRGKLGEGKAREEEQSEEEQLKKVESRKNKFYEYVKNTEVSEYFKIINELNKTSDEKDINIIVENAKKALLENKITTDEYHGLLYNVKFKKENADKEKASKPNEKSESGKEGPEDDGEERQ